MPIRQTTPAEAHDALARDAAAVYLDVRTEGEFEAGHPAGAKNVPVLLLDPASGQPRPNPEFVAVVARRFPPSTRLFVGCQSGGRSQRACELLAEAGFTDLANVYGGFGGARDPAGGIVPGWEACGLPVERGTPAGAGYADLRK
jgi:rhodanese-related sulfurtransferase